MIARNKKITTQKGKEINYSFKEGKRDGDCYICGKETQKGFLKKEVIKPTFTDHQLCKCKESNIVCECCAFLLSFSELRNYGIFATKTQFVHPSISEYKDIILKNKEVPFVLCIPTSGQKWIHIKSKLNYSTERINVNLEEQTISFQRNEFKGLLEKVETLYNAGFGITKDEIEHLSFNGSKILKMGLKEYQRICAELERYKNTRLMKLCCYLAQKEDKE